MSPSPPTPDGALRVVAGAWLRDGRLLAAQRRADRHVGGCWELPGGKVEPGEDDRAALARELSEELGVEVEVGGLLAHHVHAYPSRRIHLLAFEVACADDPHCHDHAALRWLPRHQLQEVRWAEADRPLVVAVAERMRALESPC